jgi:hypothetical protein
MLEELWEDRVGQLDTVEDIKHVALLGPRDEVLYGRVLDHPKVLTNKRKEPIIQTIR